MINTIPLQKIERGESRKRVDLVRQNTILCKKSVNKFEQTLNDKLFSRSKQKVQWEELYYHIKTFGILASETQIWNLFLDEDRKVNDNTFSPKDITRHRIQWLFNMSNSYKTWREKPKVFWKINLFRSMFTHKFLIGNGCNFLITLLIFVMTLLLLTVAVFPVGEGIVDTFMICQIVMSIYAAGCLWYFFTLLGELWYPFTYGGFLVNFVFMITSGTFCYFFGLVITPSYYEERNCFRCPACSETTDKLCFEYSKFSASIAKSLSESNTCSCALEERLRIHEPIIPLREADNYCGGDDCSCEAILARSTENWSESQEYYTCVYYSHAGTPNFFLFAGLIIVFMVIDFFVSSFCCIYVLIMTFGCGKLCCRGCICCGIVWGDEQDEAEQSYENIIDERERRINGTRI